MVVKFIDSSQIGATESNLLRGQSTCRKENIKDLNSKQLVRIRHKKAIKQTLKSHQRNTYTSKCIQYKLNLSGSFHAINQVLLG